MAERGSIDIFVGVKGGADITAKGSSGKNIADTLNQIEKNLGPINIKVSLSENTKKKLTDGLSTIKKSLDENLNISGVQKNFTDSMKTMLKSLRDFSNDVEKQSKEISEKLAGALNLGNSLTLNATIDPEQFKSLKNSMSALAVSVGSLRKVLGEVDGVSEAVAKNTKDAADSAVAAVKDAEQATTDAGKPAEKKKGSKKSSDLTTTKEQAAAIKRRSEVGSSIVQGVQEKAAAETANIDAVNAAIIKLSDSMDHLLVSLETIAKFDLNNIVIQNVTGVTQDVSNASSAVGSVATSVQQAGDAVQSSTSELSQFSVVLGALSSAMQDIGAFAKQVQVSLGLSQDKDDAKTLKDYLDGILADLKLIGEKENVVNVSAPWGSGGIAHYTEDSIENISNKINTIVELLPQTKEMIAEAFSAKSTSSTERFSEILDKLVVSGRNYVEVAKELSHIPFPDHYLPNESILSEIYKMKPGDIDKADEMFRQRYPSTIAKDRVHFSEHLNYDMKSQAFAAAQIESSGIRAQSILSYLLGHFNIGNLGGLVQIGDSTGLSEYFEGLADDRESAGLTHVADVLRGAAQQISTAVEEAGIGDRSRAATISGNLLLPQNSSVPPTIIVQGGLKATTIQEDLDARQFAIDNGKDVNSVFGGSIEGSVVHEFGHVVATFFYQKLAEELNSISAEFPEAMNSGIKLFSVADQRDKLKEYFANNNIDAASQFPAIAMELWMQGLDKDSIKSGLSKYAATNYEELFAEAFAELFTINPRSIAQKFGQMLSSALGSDFTDLPIYGFNTSADKGATSGAVSAGSGVAINVHIDQGSISDIQGAIASAIGSAFASNGVPAAGAVEIGGQAAANNGEPYVDIIAAIENVRAILSDIQARMSVETLGESVQSSSPTGASDLIAVYDADLAVHVSNIRTALDSYITSQSSGQNDDCCRELIGVAQKIFETLSSYFSGLQNQSNTQQPVQQTEYPVKDAELIIIASEIRAEVSAARSILENGIQLSGQTNLDTVYNYLSAILTAIQDKGIQASLRVVDRESINELKRISGVSPNGSQGGGNGNPNTSKYQQVSGLFQSYRSAVNLREQLQAEYDAAYNAESKNQAVIDDLLISLDEVKHKAENLRQEITNILTDDDVVLQRWTEKMDAAVGQAQRSVDLRKDKSNVREIKVRVKNADKVTDWVERTKKELDGLSTNNIDSVKTLPGLNFNITDKMLDVNEPRNVVKATDLLNEYIKAFEKIQYDVANKPLINKDNLAQIKLAQKAAASYYEEVKRLNKEYTTQMKFESIANQAESEYERFKTTISSNYEVNQKWQQFFEDVRNGIYKTAQDATTALENLRKETTEKGLYAENILQKISRIFSDKLIYGAIGKLAQQVRRLLPEMYQYIVQIDDAMSQFAIVTNASAQELEKFGKRAYKIAQETATSVTDVINAATVYSRLGFSGEESLQYSELTTMYSKVGAVDVSAAEDAITAMIKAFSLGTDDLENALDKMIAVGNNAPISASQLGRLLPNRTVMCGTTLAQNGETPEEDNPVGKTYICPCNDHSIIAIWCVCQPQFLGERMV